MSRVARAFLLRLVVAYLILYMLPFPVSLLGYLPRLPLLGDIPGFGAAIGWITGLWWNLLGPIVTWVGDTLFGVDVAMGPSGSGDRTVNYVQLFVTASVALLVAAIWTALVRARRLSPRGLDGMRVAARFYLGTTLLAYGWVKVLPLQFPVPGPDRLLQPYGDSSPMGLAWTFLGASAGYQIFSGLCELAGGYLLFWRRTALAGALVAAAVMTNVMAINYFYDVPVKLFSTHLLLFALFLIAPDTARLGRLIGVDGPGFRADRPFWSAAGRRRLAVLAGHFALIAMVTTFNVTGGLASARQYGFLREDWALTGIYRVESFERDGLLDRENEDADRWVRVGIGRRGVANIQRATGDSERMLMTVDEEAATLTFDDRGREPPQEGVLSYTVVEPGVVRLEGDWLGVPVIVTMRKTEGETLLLDRGYHWINEFPFNR